MFDGKKVDEFKIKDNHTKATIYTIPISKNVKQLGFDVVYLDPSCDAKMEITIRKKTFSEFKSALENVRRSPPPYEYIKSCTFWLSYEHPMQEQRMFDFMIDYRTGYKSEAVRECAKTLLIWINKHPEWLV